MFYKIKENHASDPDHKTFSKSNDSCGKNETDNIPIKMYNKPKNKR